MRRLLDKLPAGQLFPNLNRNIFTEPLAQDYSEEIQQRFVDSSVMNRDDKILDNLGKMAMKTKDRMWENKFQEYVRKLRWKTLEVSCGGRHAVAIR